MLIALNKPYRVLSQFSDRQGRQTLKHCVDLPDVYPAGRLDYDSEGLVLLTDDGRLQARIADPRHGLSKCYYVQVEGRPEKRDMNRLRRGVHLKDGPARCVRAELVAEPEWLWERDPPIRFRQSVPDSWLRIELKEGRNRQVRRMTAAVGFPTLRLIRWAVGHWSLDELQPGEWRELIGTFWN